MMRVCNLDTCPVGIATQNPELRKRFAGKPEYVINFMRFIAEELREYMAKLGIRTVDELVGRTDLLKVRDVPTSKRAATLDLSRILNNPYAKEKKGMIFNPKKVFDFELNKTLDERVLVKELLPSLEKKQKRILELDVKNTDRTFGTIFGSEITRRYPDGLEEDSYVLKCKGAGGQSFGAFIPKGLTLELTGDSNDYFGKGLSGGKLIVYPPTGVKFKADENIIIGNVALYGATSGKAYINGVAGERFCVRNSGATAVVEGVGDHGCEYMTGGRVAILGKTGKNFAAGMSGGVAYVLDMDSDLYTKVNKQMVNIEKVTSKDKNGNLCKVVLVKLESKKDEKTERMMMAEVAGSEYTLNAELVLIAAGFLGSEDYVTKAFGVEVNERTNVKTAPGEYKTNVPNIFTAGDMHRGQSLVVWAIREGREAAQQIDLDLMGYTNLSVQ